MNPKSTSKIRLNKLPKKIRAIDFGAGAAEWIKKQAKRKTKKTYIAVDNIYAHKSQSRKKRQKNLFFIPTTTEETIRLLKEKGKTTKYATIRMPNPIDTQTKHLNLVKIISEIKKILEPNGSIIITTESKEIERKISLAAKENDLSIKKRTLGKPRTAWEKMIASSKIPINTYILRNKKQIPKV